MRKVKYFQNCFTDQNGFERIEAGEGWFHQWVDTVNFDNKGKQYPITLALVERPDGSIMRLDPELVQFMEQPNNV